jgi:hypothetical protein
MKRLETESPFDSNLQLRICFFLCNKFEESCFSDNISWTRQSRRDEMFIAHLAIYGLIAPEERNMYDALLRSSGAWTGGDRCSYKHSAPPELNAFGCRSAALYPRSRTLI